MGEGGEAVTGHVVGDAGNASREVFADEAARDCFSRRIGNCVDNDVRVAPLALQQVERAESIWPSTVTSSGIVSFDPMECARGSTRSFILSFT